MVHRFTNQKWESRARLILIIETPRRNQKFKGDAMSENILFQG
jgi:hypothetical protein